MPSQDFPGGSQRGFAAAAMEERGRELRFEFAHLLAESGLGEMEGLRGAGEAAQLGNLQEVLELADVHRL